MKKSFLVSALLAVLAISGCQVKEEGEFAPKGKTFTATMEVMVDNESSVGTKTSLDNSNILWKQGDRVSIFNASYVNECYQVTDESDGKTSASLYQVTSPGFVAGGEISNNVAFYPYASTAGIAKSGNNYVISDIALPSTQDYAEDSFGNGAYPMAAVTSSTSDNKLKFKNVLGGLKLQVKGTAAVTSISVTGNNDEKLCGAASVTVSNTAVPTLTLSDATATTVTLDCGDGIQLDAETVTAFIIALPPMTMEGGFTITLNGADGSTKEVSTTKSQTITRSNILKMPAITFDAAPVVAGPKYVKVTSNDDIEEDAQYILVYESANKAFKPILASAGTSFTKSTANAIDVVISNNTISSDDLDDCLITFENGKYLFIESAGDNGKYLYPGASGTSALGAEDKTESHTVSISIASDGIATIARTSDAAYHLYWSSSNYFSGIQQSGQNAGPQYDANICLYKLYDDRTPQSLSFSADEAEYDVFVNKWVEGKGVPGLSGAETTVTYASSNESVATVDPTSGAVTIASGAKKGDKAVITATAEKDATWRAAKASYTITIINSDPAKVMYSKVTSADDVVADGTYVFVYRSGSTVKAFKPVLNSGKTAFQQTVDNAVDVTITADDQIDSEDVEGCEIILTNQDGTDMKFSMVVPVADGTNDYYFVLRNNTTSFVASTTENGYRSSFAISSTGALTITRSNYRFRYSSSSNYFQASTSSASSLELFKLDDNQPKKRNLAFSASEVSVNIYGQSLPYAYAGAPTLSGKTDGVTYSVTCSDSSIATSAYPSVSASGAVTINGTGVFTIKASAPATAELQAGEASYTLTVMNNAPATYTKVSEITSGATYLIVSTDANNYNGKGQKMAFAGDQAGSAVEVDGTSGTITGDYDSCEFVITAEGESYVLDGPEGYVTGNSATTYSRYIQVSSSKVTMSLTDAATLKAAASTDGTVSDAFYFYYTKSDGKKDVLYFNSDDKFKIGGTGRQYGVYLYKKN